MDTLKTYLTHIAATAGSTAFVTFDTLSTETDTETTGTTTTSLTLNGFPIPSASVITVLAPFAIPSIGIELTLPMFKVADPPAGT